MKRAVTTRAETLSASSELNEAERDRFRANLLINGIPETAFLRLAAQIEVKRCEPGDVIPMDGEIIEGIATIDESAITGESAPVIREAGGDKSSVTGGT